MALAQVLSEKSYQGMPESEEPMEGAEDAGRGGDTVLAHLSLGELVIPRAFLDDPDFMNAMKQVFESQGANINQYIVGDEANSINPETGYPEFFFKKLKRIFKSVAPLALAYFAPGIGTALGATGAGAAALGGAVAGGAGGLISGGGLKSALTGAALGGAGGYIGGGGLNDTALGRGVNSIYSDAVGGINSASNSLGAGNLLNAGGKIFGTSLDTSYGPQLPSGGGSSSYSKTPGGAGANPLEGTSTAGGEGVSSYKKLSDLLSTGLGLYGQDNAEDELLKANQQAAGYLQPFATQSFEPGDLASDPGYQFRLKQGQEALDARNAATGGYYSGAAQQQAGQFASDFAGQEYQSAYERYLQNQAQRAKAAGGLAILAGNTGDVRANAGISQGNLISRGLSGFFGGGFNASGDSYDNNDAKQRLIARMGA